MTAVGDLSTYGTFQVNKVLVDKLASGQGNLVLSSSKLGDANENKRNFMTFVGGVAAPTLTFDGTGIGVGTTVQLKGLSDPTGPNDAVTKQYADGIAAGIDVRGSVKVATIAVLDAINAATYVNGTNGVGATLTETTTTAGTLTVDGVSVLVGHRILVKNQPQIQNGIYVATTANTSVAWVLTRATDTNNAANFSPGVFTFVEAGTLGGKGFVATGTASGTNGGYDVGVNSIPFTQFSSAVEGALYTFSNPLLNTSGTVSVQSSTPLGLVGGALTVVGTANGSADAGKFLVAGANATTASVYSDTFGTGTSNSSLKVAPPATLPTTTDTATLTTGAIQIAATKSIATGERTPALMFGSNAAQNSSAIYASVGTANLSQVNIVTRNIGGTWDTIAVFSKTVT